MPNLTIVTYCSSFPKALSKTEQSILSQTYKDYEWVVLKDGEPAHTSDSEYLLFLSPGEVLAEKKVLQKVFDNSHCEDIVFGDALIKKPFHRTKAIGPKGDDISLFRMMEHPIALSAAFIKRSLIDERTLTSTFAEPTHWLEFLLKSFFLGNCPIKYTNCAISKTTADAYKTMYNIEKQCQQEIIQSIMPRLVNSRNRLYSQSETNEALRLFLFLQRNKLALYLYNHFLKPKGGLDA